jgi:hypothetical protein
MAYFTKRPVQRVILPSDKDVWVDVYTKFTWKQEKDIGDAITAGKSHPDAILQNVIADWNLTDESDEVVAVDGDHIDLLERSDAIAIITAVNGLSVVEDGKEAKKTSSNASPKR